jgi:hypothetical protein
MNVKDALLCKLIYSWMFVMLKKKKKEMRGMTSYTSASHLHKLATSASCRQLKNGSTSWFYCSPLDEGAAYSTRDHLILWYMKRSLSDMEPCCPLMARRSLRTDKNGIFKELDDKVCTHTHNLGFEDKKPYCETTSSPSEDGPEAISGYTPCFRLN